MDWITHAAVGAAFGEIMLGKRIGNAALAWGAVLGIAPDLVEALVALFLTTTASLSFQAAGTHSPLFAALLALTLPRWLAPMWKRAKVTPTRIRWFIVLGWASHVLVDCLSSPGVQVCWPISAPRFGCQLLHPQDGLPGLCLGLTMLALTFLRSKKEQRKRRRLWWWGVGLSGGYLGLALAAKWAVSTGFGADLARRGAAVARRTEAPTPWNLLLWRGMADCGDEIWVGYRSVFEWPGSPVRWSVFPRNPAAFARYADASEARRMALFSNGWWLARPNKTGLWMADVQSGESRVWGERKGMVDLRFRDAWHYEPEVAGDPVHAILPDAKNRADAVARLLWRTIGRGESWEATPRLAGVPGALPEPLRTEE